MKLSTIIIFIVIFYLINYLWISLYCTVEEKVDRKKYKNNLIKSDSKEKILPKEKHSKVLLKKIYKRLDRYMYGWMRYWIIRTGRIPSNRIRKVLYKYVFKMKISKGTVISYGCEIRSPWNIELGKCIVAGGCILDGRAGIIIHDNVVLGMNVHIWTEEHDVNSPEFEVNDAHRGSVVIHSRAWVCSDSTILPGNVIGEGSVVAAKACVVKSCEPYGIYGGVPAKKIADRNQNLKYTLSGRPHWHFN